MTWQILDQNLLAELFLLNHVGDRLLLDPKATLALRFIELKDV